MCYSCFASARLGGELLRRGANPNAFSTNEYGRMPALYGAAGIAHDPELTGLLLEAGADVNDGESLYHATEAEQPDCLALLLQHGARPAGTNALAHALDEDRVEHVRLLLDAGADPNEGALLAHAVRRGRGPDVLRLLVERGAELDRPGGETWRGNVPLRTPYQHARLRNREDVAQLLAELGASNHVAPEDLAVAAVARGELPALSLPEELDVDAQEVLILAALDGELDSVLAARGPSFAGVVGGSPVGTLLHHAAWVGEPALVRELLARGADPSARPDPGAGSPLSWAVHGSAYGDRPGADHVGVAEALVGAGLRPEPGDVEQAHGSLYEWLSSRGG